MIKARKIGLGILAAASLAFGASAHAHPGGGMGPGATGAQHGQHAGAQGPQAGMQGRMAQRMGQMGQQGEHARGRQGAAAGGCPMQSAQANTQGGHTH